MASSQSSTKNSLTHSLRIHVSTVVMIYFSLYNVNMWIFIVKIIIFFIIGLIISVSYIIFLNFIISKFLLNYCLWKQSWPGCMWHYSSSLFGKVCWLAWLTVHYLFYLLYKPYDSRAFSCPFPAVFDVPRLYLSCRYFSTYLRKARGKTWRHRRMHTVGKNY